MRVCTVISEHKVEEQTLLRAVRHGTGAQSSTQKEHIHTMEVLQWGEKDM